MVRCSIHSISLLCSWRFVSFFLDRFQRFLYLLHTLAIMDSIHICLIIEWTRKKNTFHFLPFAWLARCVYIAKMRKSTKNMQIIQIWSSENKGEIKVELVLCVSVYVWIICIMCIVVVIFVVNFLVHDWTLSSFSDMNADTESQSKYQVASPQHSCNSSKPFLFF